MRREHHLPVSRTARYYTTGEPHAGVRELWFVCHGYGQLAGRFIRHFEAIATPERLIVAPEALSRFYVEVQGKTHADTHVGASWMTREDRLSDIEDYVEYLDALHAHIWSALGGALPVFTAFGFSQGVATVARWLERTKVHVDRALFWGNAIPGDIRSRRGSGDARGAHRVDRRHRGRARDPRNARRPGRPARLERNRVRARELQRKPPH